MGKKRKSDAPEADGDLYRKFANAATAVSLLYTHAEQQRKRHQAQGARHALERQVRWLQLHYGTAPVMPIPNLINYLQYEIENVDNLDTVDLPRKVPSLSYEGRKSGGKTPSKRYTGVSPVHVHHSDPRVLDGCEGLSVPSWSPYNLGPG